MKHLHKFSKICTPYLYFGTNKWFITIIAICYICLTVTAFSKNHVGPK